MKAIESHLAGNYLAFYGKYLPEAKQIGGDEYRAACPFHDDINPSLTFSNQTGKYYCHGCGKKGHIAHFYAKLHGLDTKLDYPKILSSISHEINLPIEKEKPKMIAAYDYHDINGGLLFQVCRMQPKNFWQRRPDGNGSWITKDIFKKEKGGIDPVLYRLPAIAKANEIIIVEGEKDVDLLVGMNFVGATTCPMGAKKWRHTYNETLRGKDVVLIPDNDEEGRAHMAQIGAAIKDVVASLKWLELPNLPSKGDVSDWVAKVGDRETAAERLAVMIENADLYEPPKQVTFEDAIWDDETIERIELPEKRTILNPWCKEQTITLIPGWRGIGKTYFAMGLVDAITRGIPFGPWQIVESVPCFYLEGEMAAEDVRGRIRAFKRSERKSPLYTYSDAYANMLGLPRANLLSDKWRTNMRAFLVSRKVKLWVVDNLSSLTPGTDENLKKDWDPINQWLLQLRFDGIATILLHHVGKGGGQRGTSGREDNIDSTILLRLPPDYTVEDGAKFITRFDKSRSVRTRDLPLIADTMFQLDEDQDGKLSWNWGSVKRETKVEIMKLMDDGHKQTEVAELLGITRGYVSRIVKVATKEGHLSSKGKLTQSGLRMVHDTCEE
jgi:hypothetical protein